MGCGYGIAKRSVGIAFGVWGCDRYFRDVESAIAFGDVGVRSRFGMCEKCDRCFGSVEGAIAVWDFGSAIACWGYWECDRVWGCVEGAIAFGDAIAVLVMLGVRSLFGDVGNAIAFGM